MLLTSSMACHICHSGCHLPSADHVSVSSLGPRLQKYVLSRDHLAKSKLQMRPDVLCQRIVQDVICNRILF